MREHPELGRVGECALEVYPPPVKETATCVRWRPKGATAPPPRPRAAGEPRRHHARAPVERSPRAPAAEPARPELPKEIDIDMDIKEFRRVLRQVIAEELGIGKVELGRRWQGGELILKPGQPDVQEKRVPLESFFHKIVMVRDRLRVLEARINAHEGLSNEDKIQLQQYITACYGTLTTFNALFADRDDWFSMK